MDYQALARELFEAMQANPMVRQHRGTMDEAVRGEKFMLHFLARRGGFVLPGELSHEMGVSSARVAAALNRLEQKGLVTRQIDPDDRRRILVSITSAGMEEHRAQQEKMLEKGTGLLERLGEQDAREYVRIMCRMAELAKDDFCGE